METCERPNTVLSMTQSIFTEVEVAARLVMMILTVIVEFCSHVSFTDMMTDDRTELNVLTLYHYN